MAEKFDVSELTFETLDRVRGYLSWLLKHDGSDLHIKANSQVRCRINGDIVPIDNAIMTKKDALVFAKEILRNRFTELVEKKEVDLVFPYDNKVRFRVNIFFQMDGVSAVFRMIPINIISMDELKMPSPVKKLVEMDRGLVLVVGVTGSGKSTTLAAMINEINKNSRRHILTIEDPIEFVHKDNKSIVNQRSIGQDTHSFANALKASLREDPDIILVGEMRDAETINIALHAAETGHLVFSTLHTVDAKETINRIIATFGKEEQNRIRLTLSSVLRGILAQRLIPTIDGKRIAAIEVLLNTPRISTLIMDNRDNEILESIEDGKEIYKMQSFDQALLELYQKGFISEQEALNYATSKSDLKLKISGVSGNIDIKKGMSQNKDEKTFTENEIYAIKV